MSTIGDLTRRNIRNLAPYSSARDEFRGSDAIFLDANENAWGNAVCAGYNRYPDSKHENVRDLIAALHGFARNRIFLGNGSDEAIDLLIRAFCEPERDSILIFPPTYGMYGVQAAIQNVQVAQIPLTDEFELKPVGEMIDAKLTFVCSPNNPTGTAFEAGTILSLLDRTSGLVVVDEAYIDFSPNKSLIRAVEHNPRLVILRTFSKAWGLAGIRAGYVIAHPEVIEVLMRIKPPYNVNSWTLGMLSQVLQRPHAVQHGVARILRERDRLTETLERYCFVQRVYPSDANFLLVRVQDAEQLYRYLIERKIIIRNRSHELGCAHCVRVTVGTERENDELLSACSNFEKEKIYA